MTCVIVTVKLLTVSKLFSPFDIQEENLKILVSSFGTKDWRTIASFLPVSDPERKHS